MMVHEQEDREVVSIIRFVVSTIGLPVSILEGIHLSQ